MDLVLNTYGVALSCDNEGFVVTSEGVRQRVPIQGISSILVSRGASITSDAVLLAVKNEIEILFTDRRGKPMGRVWSPKYGSISTIRKGQLAFTASHEAVTWIRGILSRKVENQQALMLMVDAADEQDRQYVSRAIERVEDYRRKIERLDGDCVADIAAQLRGWEGSVSRIYFETMNLFIPERLRFAMRSQNPAVDPANAMLNYGYGVLYGKIEGDMIRAGIDPYIGVMHRDEYNRPVLVYDVIELYRYWVDYVVYQLLAQDVITDEYYSMREDGSCWLESLGRQLLIQSLNDYLCDVVTMDGIPRSRESHMFLYIQNLAQTFKSYCR